MSFSLCVVFSLCLCVSVVSSNAPQYPDKNKLLVLRDGDGIEKPIRTAEDWAKRARRRGVVLTPCDRIGFPQLTAYAAAPAAERASPAIHTGA